MAHDPTRNEHCQVAVLMGFLLPMPLGCNLTSSGAQGWEPLAGAGALLTLPMVTGYWQPIPNPTLTKLWASCLEEGRCFISGKRRKIQTKQNNSGAAAGKTDT